MQTQDVIEKKSKVGRKQTEKALMPKKAFLVDGAIPCEASLTGNKFWKNPSSSSFMVHPEWSIDRVKVAGEDWLAYIEALPVFQRPTIELLDLAKRAFAATSKKEFAAALSALIVDGYHKNKGKPKTAKAKARLLELCVRFWAEKCLLFPTRDFAAFDKAHLGPDTWGFDKLSGLMKNVYSAMESSAPKAGRTKFRLFIRSSVSFGPLRSVGDFDPDTVSVDISSGCMSAYASGFLAGIIRLQVEEHPDKKPFTTGDFGWEPGKIQFKRDDKRFLWLADKDPEMEQWRVLAAEFIETFRGGFSDAILGINAWFDFVLENETIQKDPLAFFERKNQKDIPAITLESLGINDKRMCLVHDFFAWILLEKAAAPDDYGTPLVLPNFKNPVLRPIRTSRNLMETHREPMPTRFVNMCLTILEENDCAWAKSISGDTVKWRNPKTGLMESVWSPIRVWFLMLKLILPTRTFQLRMVESGEVDTLCYRPEKGGWVPNTASPAKKRSKSGLIQRGVFRKFQRKDGSEGCLLYFNTNKTADIDVEVSKRGYVMPWEHHKAIGILLKVRDWQEKYNPARLPVPWSEIPEVGNRRNEEDLAKMGSAHFLFRDPANFRRPSMPITDTRIRTMWVRLLEELERRLEASGDTLPNGQPHKLITSRTAGRAVGTLFDLHSLRVTMISALYEQGVRPEVIMKIVGHASVVMTLYYTKISPSAISETLNEAFIAKNKDEQRNWIGYLKTKEAEELKSYAAHRDHAGLAALSSSTGASIVVMDHGFCPMGARRCSDGLFVPAVEEGGRSSTAPVPGGASNCVRCRFFVTGPAFLVGMEAHVNDLAYRLKNASEGYGEAQSKFEGLSLERDTALDDGLPFTQTRDLQNAEAAYEKTLAEVDSIALSFQAACDLAQQSAQIANKGSLSDSVEEGTALTVAGGGTIDAVFEETHCFEQLHKLCHGARFFESLKIDTGRANLERLRLFDRILARSGLSPSFCLIENETVARRVADEMGQFLLSRLGKKELADLMDGKSTLQAIGLSKDFEDKMRLEHKRMELDAIPSGLLIEGKDLK